MRGLEIESGFASETGLRAGNEDYGAVSAPGGAMRAKRGVLAAVADGIGGAPGGREAAEIAVETFIEIYYGAGGWLSITEATQRALAGANARILQAAEQKPALRGMGTTLSVLILAGARGYTLHIGDSRIYRMRGSQLTRLTEDHNLAAQGYPNVLTRALGNPAGKPADQAVHAVSKGDRFFLCTDGISGVLSDSDLAGILRDEPVAEVAVRLAVAAALEAGTTDNATALIVDVMAVPAG